MEQIAVNKIKAICFTFEFKSLNLITPTVTKTSIKTKAPISAALKRNELYNFSILTMISLSIITSFYFLREAFCKSTIQLLLASFSIRLNPTVALSNEIIRFLKAWENTYQLKTVLFL